MYLYQKKLYKWRILFVKSADKKALCRQNPVGNSDCRVVHYLYIYPLYVMQHIQRITCIVN